MQTQTTFSVIFFTRKNRANDNKLSIYARITVDGKRAEISIKRCTKTRDWDSRRKRARGNTADSKRLNAYLDQVYSQLLDCHRQIMGERGLVSAASIKSRYLGLDENLKSLKELLAYNRSHMSTTLKRGTIKNYSSTERYLLEFLSRGKKMDNIELKRIDYRFVVDFEGFLRRHRHRNGRPNLSNNGVMKHLERLKKMINLAIRLDWMQKNPFDRFRMQFERFERAHLDARELDAIERIKYRDGRMERVRDCFLFSCHTGLSYIDVRELTRDHIRRGVDGRDWIFTKREKTGETVRRPILPKARSILDRYVAEALSVGKETIMPLPSNQKTNAYLKQLAHDCCIKKNVTFHVARHTFATTVMLSNGVPIETVSKLLGHTKLSTTQIYARVVEKKISEDMDRLMDRLETGRVGDARRIQ